MKPVENQYSDGWLDNSKHQLMPSKKLDWKENLTTSKSIFSYYWWSGFPSSSLTNRTTSSTKGRDVTLEVPRNSVQI